MPAKKTPPVRPKRGRKRGGRLAYPQELPCGCAALSKGPARAQVLVLLNGARICQHEKRWVLGWVEQRSATPRKAKP